MPRLGVLWCPHWPVVVAGARGDEPVAVLHANRVIAHSLAAAAEGIALGQRRREAQARCPQVRIEAHDPARDARAFDHVVRAVGALVPRVEITEPGTLTFMARGPARYFGGESAMARTVVQAAVAAVAAELGATTTAAVGSLGLGVADGRFAAGIASRRSAAGAAPVVVPTGHAATAGFLAGLPVQLLTEVGSPRSTGPMCWHGSGRWASSHIVWPGAATTACRARTIRRQACRCSRRSSSRCTTPTRSCSSPDRWPSNSSARSPTPVRRAGLPGQPRGPREAQIHGEQSERVWYRSSGLSAAAMVERVRWQLDAWAQHDALTAGVSLLRLDPVEVRSDQGVQLGLWGGRTQADEWAVRAVARLAALAGEQQVLVPAAQGGRQPHERFTWVPAVTADLAEPADRLAPVTAPWPGSLPAPSPAVVHAVPRAIEVTDASGAPVAVNGRGVVSAPPVRVRWGDTTEAVQAWAGPWPIDERWWDGARARRLARCQVLTRSGRLLLVGVERGQWWLAAEYR